MTTRIQLRRDTAERWENINPVLADGEAGYDKTNNQIRVGDGVTPWLELATLNGGGGDSGGGPGGFSPIPYVWKGEQVNESDPIERGGMTVNADVTMLYVSGVDADGNDTGALLDEYLTEGTALQVTSEANKNRQTLTQITGPASFRLDGRAIPIQVVSERQPLNLEERVTLDLPLALVVEVALLRKELQALQSKRSRKTAG